MAIENLRKLFCFSTFKKKKLKIATWLYEAQATRKI
jgi:hypothetical protein